jgi:hypothetical protein
MHFVGFAGIKFQVVDLFPYYAKMLSFGIQPCRESDSGISFTYLTYLASISLPSTCMYEITKHYLFSRIVQYESSAYVECEGELFIPVAD